MIDLKEVNTNEGTFFTNASDKTLQHLMWAYTRKKLRGGYKLSEVKFVWGRVKFIPHQALINELMVKNEVRQMAEEGARC